MNARVAKDRTNSRQLIEVEKAEQTAKLSLSAAPKRYRPELVDSFVTQWVESGSGLDCRSNTLLGSELGSYRSRNYRSDTLLGHSDGELIPKRLAKSVGAEPNVAFARDNDGFIVSPRPPQSHSFRDDLRFDQVDSQAYFYAESVGQSDIAASINGSGGSSGKLVEDPLYRVANLASNDIYLRSRREQFPEHINTLVDYIGRDRDSPGPSADDVWQDEDLEALEMGAPEADVQSYFQAEIFPRSAGALKRSDRLPMGRGVVPDAGSNLKLSTPMPDALYGYNRTGFTEGQQAQFNSMENEMTANSQDLIYPFFVIEFKADGSSGAGSLWVATNQCLGGSASCVNIAERLNCRLKQCKSEQVQPIDIVTFSIAMNGTEARLYISWEHDELKYYTRKIDTFLLQKSKDYVEFRKHVLNIIDWSKDKHLREIRKCLDDLLEEGRRK
ncbi:hypothetical protein CJF32_00003261 [Rutstroemia sp. NJR-2017a WRK4]|nr:hypothetical protein CJF32_00003261 [Rutstroemia sp. NJR-2017a WRK4]